MLVTSRNGWRQVYSPNSIRTTEKKGCTHAMSAA